MRKMLTVAELSELLGVKPNTLRGWARTGAIPCIRLTPGCIRFDAREIERMLNDRHTRKSRQG